MTVREVLSFVRYHFSMAREYDDVDQYFGVWYALGTVHLDKCTWVETREEAESLARERNEDAYFDVSVAESVYIVY
jgi:hypothetical protein